MLTEQDKLIVRFAAYIAVLEQANSEQRASLSAARQRINELEAQWAAGQGDPTNGEIDGSNQS